MSDNTVIVQWRSRICRLFAFVADENQCFSNKTSYKNTIHTVDYVHKNSKREARGGISLSRCLILKIIALGALTLG